MRVGVAGILAATVVAEADSSCSTAGSFIYPQGSQNKPVLEVLSASSSREASWAATSRYRNGADNHRSYKTRLCENFKQSGTCIYGDKCTHAHSKAELRERLNPLKHKTEPCKNTIAGKDCAFGAKCDFAHSEGEMLENRKRVAHELYPGPVRFRAPDDVFQDRFAEKHAAKLHHAMRKSLSALMIPTATASTPASAYQKQPHSAPPGKLENVQNLHPVAPEMLSQPGLVPPVRELTALHHASLLNCEREPALQASPMRPHLQLQLQQNQFSNTMGLPAQQKYGNASSAFANVSSSVPYSGLLTPQTSQMLQSYTPEQYPVYVSQMTTMPLVAAGAQPFSQTQIPPMQFISPGYMPFGPGTFQHSQSNNIQHPVRIPAVVPALRTAVSLDQDMLESGSFGQYMDQHPGIPYSETARATHRCHCGNATCNGSPLLPHSPMVFQLCSSDAIPVPGENIGSLMEMRLSDYFEQRANQRVSWTPDIAASLAPPNPPEESDINGSSKGSFDYRAILLGTNISS